MKPKEVLEYAKKNGVQMVDFKFCDLPGTWQHFTTPVSELEEAVFEEGLGFFFQWAVPRRAGGAGLLFEIGKLAADSGAMGEDAP